MSLDLLRMSTAHDINFLYSSNSEEFQGIIDDRRVCERQQALERNQSTPGIGLKKLKPSAFLQSTA